MSEPTPPVPPFESTPLPDYKDRSTGLLVFGILTLLLGCFAGLFVLLMLGQTRMPRPEGSPPANLLGILLVIGIYGGLAASLIWLGIGSIKARRWARALLLIFSWSWLIMGVLMTAIMPFVMSKVFANLPSNTKTGQPAMPPGAVTGIIIGMTLFFLVGFVLLPAVWVFFYNSRHVKATCEARDPVKRWTDACPLPVLAFCLWTWLAVPMMLLMPLTGQAVMPFFGMFITGFPAALFCLVVAAVWGMSGWWLYRLDARGWWLILAAMILFMVSALLTYAHHDIREMYQLQGLPQAQIDQIEKMGLLTGNRMGWFTALFSLPFLGYLLFIKKYLRKG
ncbi:MAG TPA: hypothetical protein VK327_14055 [Candidatus Paceibacterota bacterium]|nr:hypothetical protein [Candidatus Paceibacterota bacterium]